MKRGDIVAFRDRHGVWWRWDERAETWREFTHLEQFLTSYRPDQDQHDVAGDHPDRDPKNDQQTDP